METMITRRALFLGLLPKNRLFNIADKLAPGQGITHIVKADNFEMRVIVDVDKNCVLTSEQIKWYDPIDKEERFKMNNQIFITGEDEL